MISQDHVIKGSCNVMGRSSSPISVSYRSVTVVGHRPCGSEDIMILVCHVILQDHVIGYHPVKLGGHRHSDIADIVVVLCHMISQDHMIWQNHMILQDHVILSAGVHQGKLPSCQVW